jgi:hypothetical protein
MDKPIKFTFYSIIFLFVYEFVFGMDLLEFFIPEKIFYGPIMTSLGYATLALVPLLILLLIITILILSVIDGQIKKRKRLQNLSEIK